MKRKRPNSSESSTPFRRSTRLWKTDFVASRLKELFTTANSSRFEILLLMKLSINARERKLLNQPKKDARSVVFSFNVLLIQATMLKSIPMLCGRCRSASARKHTVITNGGRKSHLTSTTRKRLSSTKLQITKHEERSGARGPCEEILRRASPRP